MSDVPPKPQASALKRAYLAIEELQEKVAALSSKDREPIAIVGIGCRLPGGVDDPQSLVQLLRDGVDAVVAAPPDARSTYRQFRDDVAAPHQSMPPAGFLTQDVSAFDPQFFGIAPREAIGMDPQQRLLLEVVWEALEDAAEPPTALRETATGVFIGVCGNDYAQIQIASRDTDLLNAHFTSGIGHSVVSGRLSYFLGLRGPSLSVDTACSSSLVATHLACRSLRTGESDVAIAGGVNLILDSDLTVAFMRSGMLSPDGRCKTFSDGANGFARAEGCGAVILKRLSSALADGNRIYAVIKGIAVNQDGPSSALSAPSGPAQEAVIRAALANGGLEPAEIDYVEAHGTGTELGDPIEVRALNAVFGGDRAGRSPVVIGSLKTNVGHLESTAGIAGLIKTALALHEGFIPKHLHCGERSRHIPWAEINLEVASRARDWPRGQRSRRAGVSSFGFSGTNCHVVLEEAPLRGTAQPAPAELPNVLTLSAASKPALAVLASRYARVLADVSEAQLADACYTSNVGRAHLSYRLSVTGRSGKDLAANLNAWGQDGWAAKTLSGRTPVERPRIAFAFTGQGSQYAGMGRRWSELSGAFRLSIESCRATFRDATGEDLADVLFGNRLELLQETRLAQPALFVLETALANDLLRFGVRPAALFGHSIGEYAAACVAGVFSLDDGVRLTALRGELIQRRSPEGAMLAVAADETIVADWVSRRSAEVSIAAINGPRSIVVAGTPSAIDALEQELAKRQIRTRRLHVNRAFHSPLMDPVLDDFEAAVRAVPLRPPKIRLISGVTGQPLDAAEVTSSRYWRRHVREPVLFARSAAAYATQPGIVLEVGPHNVLSTFESDGKTAAALTWIPSLRRDADDGESIAAALQSLYAAGVTIDWRAVHDRSPRQRVALPRYAFQRQRCWIEPKALVPAASGEPTLHPLLGRGLDSPLPLRQFESRVSAREHSFVADHCVAGSVIMPAAGLLEVARAAAQDTLRGPVIIEQLELQAAMPMSADGVMRLHTVVEAAGSGGTVRVYSRDAAVSDGNWTLHATGRYASVQEGASGQHQNLDAVRARCTVAVGHEEFYRNLGERQLRFGPALKGVRSAAVGPGEALARVELPEALAGEAPLYGVHPALLDACLQVIALTVGEPGEAAALYLPISIGRFRLRGTVSGRCDVHARRSSQATSELLGADVVVYDERGNVVIELADLRFKAATAATLRQISAPQVEQYLYVPEWKPVAVATGERRALLQQWVSRLPVALAERAAEHDLADYEKFFAEFEALCAGYFGAALDDLGWRGDAPASTAAALAKTLGVVPQHERLFQRMLAILTEVGMLRVDAAGRFGAGLQLPTEDLAGRLNDLERRFSCARAEIALARRCGPEFARALRGQCDPLELLFPAGSSVDAEELYRDSPLATIFNSTIADAIEHLAAGGERLRVIEIGGGTGGTTSHVLERIGDRVDYTFTDVSGLFTNRARARFGRYSNVEYRELDIERDPLAQGFPERAFDVVIASNVLHATADLRVTLRHVQRLMAPGAALIALEVLAPHRWFDLTVGLTPGWWRFEDRDLRPDYACASAEIWTRVLDELGFANARVVAGATQGFGVFARQGIVVAEVSPRAERGGDWLILADQGGVGQQLARELEAAGSPCRVVTTADGAAIDALVVEGRWRGVVHLGSLDVMRWSDGASALLDRELEAACGSALALAKTCAAMEPQKAPVVWFVTRGAQPATGDEFRIEPAQATLWGLAKTIDSEHPSLVLRRVDLDPSNPYDQAGALLPLMIGGTEDSQLALRDGRWLAPRLQRWRRVGRRPIVEGGGPYRLDFDERGSIDALRFRPAERRRPGPDEVEVRVSASALNFKDVLNVLGLYPGDPGALGSEFAGVVESVGSRVEGLVAGDRVMGFAGGGYDTFVVARAAHVARVPAGMSLERAVTVPVAFLTAAYALEHCAKLLAGERVLIHAATGGVGMAAVQIAQSIGAEVHATAGTSEKRALLRSLGVQHVYDSRTLSFADELSRTTNGRGVDVVLNSLADQFVDKSFEIVADGGRFLEIGKRGVWSAERVAQLPKRVDYHMIDWGVTAQDEPALIAGLFRNIVNRMQSGSLRPLPARMFAIERIHDAFRYMAQGKHIGKIVIAHEPHVERGIAIDANGTYVVAGGLSGLGLLTARWLVERGARHLALVGRRQAGAEAQAVLADLSARGATVRVAALDIADRAALARFLDEVRAALPPIRGVIQSAGVLDDGVLLRQTWQRFRTVFAPKVIGTQHLHELTATDPLDFFVLYSSLASLIGSAGQANHAAANAFLDALAAARRAEDRPAVSINWGPWSETGAAVRRGVIDRGATRGLFPISPADGFKALELIMGARARQVGVANVDWPTFLAERQPVPPFFEVLHSALPAGQGKVAAEREDMDWLARLQAFAPAKQRAEVLRFVRAQVGRLLGVAQSDLETDRPLSEMGLDSLLAVEIRNVLGKAFELTLPATVTFDHPSIDALAAYLYAQKFARRDTERPAESQNKDGALAEIEELSDDDVDRLIAEKLKSR